MWVCLSLGGDTGSMGSPWTYRLTMPDPFELFNTREFYPARFYSSGRKVCCCWSKERKICLMV